MPITQIPGAQAKGEVAGTATSIAVPKPANLANGDFLICHASITYDYSWTGANGANGDPTLWTMSGWSYVTGRRTPDSQYYPGAAIFIKAITNAGTEPANYTLTRTAAGSRASQYAISVEVHRGVDTANPWLVSPVFSTGPSGSGSFGDVTPPSVPCVACWHYANQNYRAAADTTVAWPAGTTELQEVVGTFNFQSTAIERRTGAGATGTRAVTVGNWGGNTPATVTAYVLKEAAFPATLVATYSVPATSATASTPSFTPGANELIVVKAMTGGTSYPINGVSGGGLSYRLDDQSAVGSTCPEKLWTASSGAGGTAMTVTATFNAYSASVPMQLIVERWSNAKVAATPALAATKTGSGAPSSVLTTVAAGSRVSYAVADWNGVTGTAAYRSSATENAKRQVSGQACFYSATQAAASAGAQTIGMTTPSTQKWTILGIEIQQSDTGYAPPVSSELAPTGWSFLIDVSNYQAGISLSTIKGLGYRGCIIKIGQGAALRDGGGTYSATLDAQWPTFRDASKALWPTTTMGYWYIGNTESPAAQAQRCKDYMGDLTIPIMLDWEDGGGDWANLVAVTNAFRAIGLRVSMLYTNLQNYATQHGATDIDSLGLSLVNSRYWLDSGTNPSQPVRATFDDILATNPTFGRTTVANGTVDVLQFTDAGNVYSTWNIDVHAFPGSEAEMATMMNNYLPLGPEPGRGFLMGVA